MQRILTRVVLPRSYHTNPKFNRTWNPNCKECIYYRDNGVHAKPEPWCTLFHNRPAAACREAEGFCGASGRNFVESSSPKEAVADPEDSAQHYWRNIAERSLYPAAWMMDGFITDAEYRARTQSFYWRLE